MELNKENLLQYSRYILRKLGHRLPPPPWIETFSWPGMQLSAFCKHCKKPFAIIGDPNIGETNDKDSPAAFWKKDWNLVEIVTEQDYDVNRAWSNSRGPRVTKQTICVLGSRDFQPKSTIIQWLFALNNPNPKTPIAEEDGPDPDDVIRNKLKQIEAKYYCDKIRTWL